MTTTVIRNADWAIVWDEAAEEHVYRRNVDVAFQENLLVHVDKDFPGKADVTIDGSRRMVMPGLVDIHAHPGHEASYRGIREEHGVRNMYMTGLFERYQAYHLDDEGRAASTEYAYCELLKSGVTTLVDIGPAWEGWTDLAAKSGLRVYHAPGFASARWKVESDSELKYVWDEAAGRKRFQAAVDFLDGVKNHPSGRLSGVLSPMQIDTCTEDLLKDALAAARERGLPFTTHISQGVLEVQEMLRRHGRTPIQWAAEIGILGPSTILGHAIFLDQHSWIRWHTDIDLSLLAQHGCTVAHCPTPFARYGNIMESFGKYLDAGVRMGIGTDTTPHNMLEEMRKASTLARIAARDIHSVELADFLYAATAGGADALLRPDLGRLAPGKKADLVLVDLDQIDMQPARDPLRSLVFHAADRAVRDVYVDGRLALDAGRPVALDQADAAGRLARAQERMLSKVAERDYLKRSGDEVTPLSLQVKP
jgi:5-methylthioadenosine/S-adenosylhomocysteine deaminase